MPRHFGPQHVRSGYAAMGSAIGRPMYKGINKGRTVAQAIAEEKVRAMRIAKALQGKKKK